MPVRRTLPQRGRTTIGAWCFADHYGPDDVSTTGGMVVPPHPHTGLQTVSWLFEGEIEHRDLPAATSWSAGGVNLMTAGAASRTPRSRHRSRPRCTACSCGSRSRRVAARRTVLRARRHDAVRVSTTRPCGCSWASSRALPATRGRMPHRTRDGLLTAARRQVDLPAGGTVDLPLDPPFEHGVLVDAGPAHVEVAGADAATEVGWAQLAYLEPGHERLVRADADPVRVVLLGGVPFGEELVMWWNFIGRSHDEVVEFPASVAVRRDRPQRPRRAVRHRGGYDGRPLPAPELPTVRLKPRR